MRGSSLPRVVWVWSLGLLVFVLLAAGCTSPGQGQGSSPSNNQSQQQGPPEGQGQQGGPGPGEHEFGMLPVGAYLPSGQDCAARVQQDHHDQQEARPENAAANQFVPGRVSMPVWKDFTAKANQQFVSRIDGHFTGTTEQILEWGACKWGLPADLLKAVATQESDWRQSTVSDESNNPQDCVAGARPPCPTSFGIMQLKDIDLPGSYPLSQQSTAFNVDYYGARIRACYEGWVTYLHDDYGPGDIWGCVGWHWSGHWKDDGAHRYVDHVQHYLDTKPWQDQTNQNR
ncbi:MAG: hypothetical protein ACRDS0_25600 [Pseudonocardiaceae bacterium]